MPPTANWTRNESRETGNTAYFYMHDTVTGVVLRVTDNGNGAYSVILQVPQRIADGNLTQKILSTHSSRSEARSWAYQWRQNHGKPRQVVMAFQNA